ncbi:hypothetical protein DY000_02017900 [Brassica cretica]|uniref:Uncharacterized protein n=1 Tax=Brassica cretica TaxID=69181 RepID=A0ABQ7CNJ2_BRACR|nr:hypothetical protein DY000_02017900 [Brassica cretica]
MADKSNQADARDIPLPENCNDVGLCQFSPFRFPNKPKGLGDKCWTQYWIYSHPNALEDASCLLATSRGFVHPEPGGSSGSGFFASLVPLSHSTLEFSITQEYAFEEIIKDNLCLAMTRKNRYPKQ